MKIKKEIHISRERFHIYACCDDSGVSVLDEIATSVDRSKEKQLRKLAATMEKAALVSPEKLPTNICHQIDEKIWQFSADSLRVLWFYDKGHLIICAHAFVKKGRKTPKKEKDKASGTMGRYFNDKKRGQLVQIGEDDE